MSEASISRIGCYGSDDGRQPRRDWRDLFIVATVATGVSYSLYAIAKVSNSFGLTITGRAF